jgi:cation diffusion facilitator CzcD-associated flavoprotein CzcO
MAGDNMASLDGDMLAVSQDTSVVNGNIAAVIEVAPTTNEAIPVINGHTSTETPAINGDLPTTSGDAPDLTEHSAGVQDAVKEPVHTDAVVVGAGFSGISAIYKLRKLGMKIQAFEAGSDFGGVWYWNRYPGARVDSETPFYQLNIPEVWRTWNFKQRFPDHIELREYVACIDKTLGLRKDVEFNSRVNSVTYDNDTARWTVKTDKGHIATCKYVILATGLLHRRFIPDFPGLDSFTGKVHHSGFWPDNLSVKGKKVGLIGAGATAVQITQELGKQADQLTVFVRRPSYCLPMRQRSWSELESIGWKSFLERLFNIGRLSRAGFPSGGPACGVFDVAREERETWFEELWARGAFNFLMCNYNDVLLDRKANREVYNFWQKKIAERLKDPAKQAIMVPEEPPYFFGTKRNPLEHDYYEVLDQSNVAVVDLNKTPLKTFQPNGMVMSDDKVHEFDMIVLATGFDSFTGS